MHADATKRRSLFRMLYAKRLTDSIPDSVTGGTIEVFCPTRHAYFEPAHCLSIIDLDPLHAWMHALHAHVQTFNICSGSGWLCCAHCQCQVLKRRRQVQKDPSICHLREECQSLNEERPFDGLLACQTKRLVSCMSGCCKMPRKRDAVLALCAV